MQFFEHVAAGLTTAGIIAAIHNRGSLVLLFIKKPHHLAIHQHHLEGHNEHFTRCNDGACATARQMSAVVASTE